MQLAPREGKVRRFAALRAADKWLFLRAIAALAVARFQLATRPFERLVARLPEAQLSNAEPSNDSQQENVSIDAELLQRVAFAVRAAAANVPWNATCLPQAIAARALLKSHGYVPTMHLGVERLGDDALAGHAWVTCGDAVVIGGEDLGRYTETHRW